MNPLSHEYDATLVRVVDGDTVVLKIDLGFKVEIEQTCNLYGVDAPELVGESHAAALAAKQFIEMSLTNVKKLRVNSAKPGPRGRYLVEVYYTLDGTDICLNEQLITFNYAKPLV